MDITTRDPIDQGASLTPKGYLLIGKLLSSKAELVFCGAAAGDGKIPEGMTPSDMNDLAHYVTDAEIIGVDNQQNGEAVVTVTIDSKGRKQGVFVTEVIVYAMDPDEGKIGYCYLPLQEDPEWIRPEGSAIGKIATFDMITIVSAVSSVSAFISPTGLVTTAQLDAVRAIAQDAFTAAQTAVTHRTVATRVRDPSKPTYGLGDGGDTVAVALETVPYTGAAEVTVSVDGNEYDVNMSTDGANAPDGTLIIRKVEDEQHE